MKRCFLKYERIRVVIHKNFSIDKQAEQVDRVKRSESGMIIDPITIESNKKIKDALDIMSHFRISGIPVVDDGKLVGILTNRDIRFETDHDILISDRMTTDKLVTVPQGTTLEKAKSILQKHRIEKVLVTDDGGKLSGLITVKDILKKENCPNASTDIHGRLICGAAVGVSDDVLDRVAALVDAQVDLVVVDSRDDYIRVDGLFQLQKNDIIKGQVTDVSASVTSFIEIKAK